MHQYISWLNLAGTFCRAIRAFPSLLCALVLVCSSQALAATNPLEQSNYQVYTGDVNGDGRQDLLMKATPRMVPIDLDDLTFVLPIPAPVASFVLLSGANGEYAVVSSPDANMLGAAWQRSDYKLSYEAPNGLNSGTVSINTAASQPLYQVALTTDSSQLQLVGMGGTVILPTINVTRWAPVAGEPFPLSWTTKNASSLSLVCTASGTGYTTAENLPVSGSRNRIAQAGWVDYPSTCTWTVTGAAGIASFTETLATLPAQTRGVTYVHTDGLGSPVAHSDATGNVTSRTRYEPYGYVAAGATPTTGFTGHANDADTGLTYMQQRYYDPVAGRFLSIDPVVTDANTGDSFNRYGYANNSPYRYLDPDGRNPAVIEGALLGGELGAVVGPVGIAVGIVGGGFTTLWLGDKAITWIASSVGGNRGSPMDVKHGTNSPTTIGGRDYSGHSQDRMQGRGVPPSAVEEAIKNGTSKPSRGNTTVHTDSKNGVEVVINSDGKVVTVKTVERDKGGGSNNNGQKKDDKPKEPESKPSKS